MSANVIPFNEPPRINHTIMNVTPEMARSWLKNNNTHNRIIVESRWRTWHKEMAEGRWKFDGSPIQFDWNGVLLNGQHRLLGLAHMPPGTVIQILVITGLDPDSQRVMDIGARRTPSDQMKVANIDGMDTTTTAALRHYIAWQDGRMFKDVVLNKIPATELIVWAEEHPDHVLKLQEISARKLRNIAKKPSAMFAVALRLHEIHDDDATSFFEQLVSGEMLPKNSPILALNRRLHKVKTGSETWSVRDAIGFTVIAWNAHRDGREMAKLQRPKGVAWTFDNFPKPH